MSGEDNERITRSGPGTPMGDLLRSYWQPAALVSEVPTDRAVVPVRLLGEDLVLFRPDATAAGEAGEWGLVSRWCAHRGVDLAFGRLDDGGLRCLYHGWLYGTDGACLEQPAEPEESRFHQRICLASYPCVERNGIVFAYLGRGDPPPLPELDCFAAAEDYTFAFKGLWECNWLQGLEGGIDPSHVSYLHRFVGEDTRDSYGQQFSEVVEGTGKQLSELVGERTRPRIDVERAEHGLRLATTRQLTDDLTHVRITNLLFPNAVVVPFGNTKVFTQWHVPVDDENHYWYMILYDFADPTDRETLLRQRLEAVSLPDYRSLRHRGNNWGFDPAEQRSLTFTGMGLDINVHDQWAVESMGPIQDRTTEHLGVADRAVSANRRLLLAALDRPTAERPTQMLPAGPASIDTVGPTDGWQEHWPGRDAERREASPWASPLPATNEAGRDLTDGER